MDFDLSEEQRAFQETARTFAREAMMPYVRDWDENETFPVEALRKAAALGFAGIYVKEDVGGSALNRLDAALIFEELAQGCTSTAAYISIHNMVAWMIDAFGGPEQRAKFLPKLCSHGAFRQLLFDRAGAGSDAASISPRRAATAMTTCSTAPRPSSLAAAFPTSMWSWRAPARAARAAFPASWWRRARPAFLSARRRRSSVGRRSRPPWSSSRTAACRWPTVSAPKGQGFKIALAGLDGGRLNIGACSIGGAQFCLDRTIDYMKERRQFGSRLADFQALQFRVADYATEMEAARLLLHRAALAVGAKEPGATRLAAQAKRLATDTGFEVVNGCLQLHGGYGYLRDYPIERVLRDVRVHQILEGTNEIMRLIVSRQLLGN